MHLVTVSIAMSVYPRVHTVADVLIVSGLVAMVLMAIHVFVGREAAWIIALTTLVFARLSSVSLPAVRSSGHIASTSLQSIQRPLVPRGSIRQTFD